MRMLQDELIHLETLLSKQLINRDDYVRVKAKITALETSLESIPNVIGKLEDNLVSLQDTASKDTLEGMASDTHPELKPFENRKAGSSIRANRPGVVSMVYKKEGEITNAGEPIVQLMHTDSPKVVAFAPLSSIETLQADQTVEVVSTGRKGTTAFGKITNISPGSFDLNDIPGIRKSDTIGYWFIVELEEGHVFHHREPVKIVCESKSPLTGWLAWIGGL